MREHTRACEEGDRRRERTSLDQLQWLKSDETRISMTHIGMHVSVPAETDISVHNIEMNGGIFQSQQHWDEWWQWLYVARRGAAWPSSGTPKTD